MTHARSTKYLKLGCAKVYKNQQLLKNTTCSTNQRESTTTIHSLLPPTSLQDQPFHQPTESVSLNQKQNILTTEKRTGFRNIYSVADKVIEHTQDNILLCDTGQDPIQSRWETTMLQKKPRNDLVYGNRRAFGGIYSYFQFVCRKLRMGYC